MERTEKFGTEAKGGSAQAREGKCFSGNNGRRGRRESRRNLGARVAASDDDCQLVNRK
jgi:hypothetical protein